MTLRIPTTRQPRPVLAATAAIAVAVAMSAALAQPAAGPATAPAAATRPAADADLRRWVADLADGDPDVRERARVDLMGLDRAALDRLRQVVSDSRPLAPSQIAALENIVAHVYLAGSDPVPPADAEARGFLGVRIATSAVEIAPGPGVRAEGMPVGVAVASRILGFDGYRMLQDGDVVIRLSADRVSEFHRPDDLSRIVMEHRAGQTVTLDVLRRGKLVRVPITLSAKPAWVAQAVFVDSAFGSAEREAAVAEYWERTFGPLVAPDPS